ncbi:MAG TPA: hypothetical protein VNA12_02125 [Mycobacteriales bacterium]|nr:hypothetical protein [Mycobacteriales bacterium]
MTISEQSRHAMFLRLESVLGEEVATTLMEHLPPVGWADVATRRDLDHQTALLSTELRSELRGEMAELRSELRGEMHELGTSLRTEMGQLSERMFDRMSAQTRTLVFTVLASSASVAAATMSASRLG